MRTDTHLWPRAIAYPARLLIADDHKLAREGLRGMLKRDPQIDAEAEAASDTEATRLCQRWRPDLVLMDVASRHDRSATRRAIRQAHPSTRVLVVTMLEDTDYLVSRLPSAVPQTHCRPGGEGCVL